MNSQNKGRQPFMSLAVHILQKAGILGAVLVSAAVILAFILPLLQACTPLFSGRLSAAYSLRQLLRITGYTFEEALASTMLALLVGIPAAFFIARRQFPGRKLLMSCAAVPLCVPPLIVALGYISTFGMAGYANRILSFLAGRKDNPFSFLYSFQGLIMTQGFYNFPIVMASVADAWSQLDGSQADSARLLGAGEARCFFSITFFQLLPALLSGAMTVFIYCFFSFMFVLLFGVTGGTTLEVAIYHAGRSSMDFKAAASLALLETLSAFLTLFLLNRVENMAKRLKGLSFAGTACKPLPLSKKERFPAVVFFSVIFIFFLLPLLSIIAASCTVRTGGHKSFSLAVWKQLFAMSSFYRSLRNSLYTATATGILCTITGLTAALLLTFPVFRGRALFRSLPLLPLAVSSVLMGLGMTKLVKRGNPALLILAQTALYWPFAFRQIQACLAKIPDSVIEAAAVLSPSRTDPLFRVILPSCRKGILSGMGFCFAMSCADATLPLVLSIHKFDTLSLFTYRLAGSYRFSHASAAGCVLGLVCILAFTLSNRGKETHGIS